MRNMEQLGDSIGAWVTYDIHQGKWSFVLNQSDNPVHAFTESNIVGEVIVSGTGLNELYNSCEVRFPHKDLADQTDFRRLTINPNDRYPNENDNKLTINMSTVNDPVVAEKIALRELRQSRQDTVVQFRTDFTGIGLSAGDVITLTLEPHGFNAKEFRIQQITEEDDDDGNILLGITALEYTDDIYDYTNVSRYKRERNKQVQIKEANASIQGSEVAALTSNNFTQLFPISAGSSVSQIESALATWGSPAWGNNYNTSGIVYPQIPFVVGEAFTNMTVICGAIQAVMKYQWYDGSTVQTRSGFYAYAPAQVLLYKGQNIQVASATLDWQTNSVTFNLTNVEPDNYFILYEPLATYDLVQPQTPNILMYDWDVVEDAAGNGASATILGFNVG
jgi:hypothetical protein